MVEVADLCASMTRMEVMLQKMNEILDRFNGVPGATTHPTVFASTSAGKLAAGTAAFFPVEGVTDDAAPLSLSPADADGVPASGTGAGESTGPAAVVLLPATSTTTASSSLASVSDATTAASAADTEASPTSPTPAAARTAISICSNSPSSATATTFNTALPASFPAKSPSSMAMSNTARSSFVVAVSPPHKSTSGPKNAHKMFDEMTSQYAVSMGSVLCIKVSHVLYPVTVDVLHQVFGPFGAEKVCVLEESPSVEAMVWFRSHQDAVQAQEHCNGCCIWDGCCVMSISVAQPVVLPSSHFSPSLATTPTVELASAVNTCANINSTPTAEDKLALVPIDAAVAVAEPWCGLQNAQAVLRGDVVSVAVGVEFAGEEADVFMCVSTPVQPLQATSSAPATSLASAQMVFHTIPCCHGGNFLNRDRVLPVHVQHMPYPVSITVLHQVFNPAKMVESICATQKPPWLPCHKVHRSWFEQSQLIAGFLLPTSPWLLVSPYLILSRVPHMMKIMLAGYHSAFLRSCHNICAHSEVEDILKGRVNWSINYILGLRLEQGVLKNVLSTACAFVCGLGAYSKQVESLLISMMMRHACSRFFSFGVTFQLAMLSVEVIFHNSNKLSTWWCQTLQKSGIVQLDYCCKRERGDVWAYMCQLQDCSQYYHSTMLLPKKALHSSVSIWQGPAYIWGHFTVSNKQDVLLAVENFWVQAEGIGAL